MADWIAVHPVCDLFPLMEGEQFSRFVTDIAENGLARPVVLHEGLLVDGRNRLRACYQLGILPIPTVEWKDEYSGEMSLEQWIWSTNVERRNLTPDQLAAAIVGRNKYERVRGEGGRFVHHPNTGDGAIRDNHRTRRRLAKEAGVSENRIERARMIQRADPDLLKEVVRGTITVADALIKVKATPKPEPTPVEQPSAEDGMRLIAVVERETRGRMERETKDRMVRVLSRVHGLCRGFDTLSIPALRNACDAKEIKEWANMARSAARVLRGFAADLLEEQREAHN